MPLRAEVFKPAALPLPRGVDRFIAEAERRIDAFAESGMSGAHVRFVPSDFVLVYDALRALRKDPALKGLRFREWGSGFGVATCLAEGLGFDAVGIEREPRLACEAGRLALAFGSKARFARGSYDPRDPDFEPAAMEADLVFAYPWPDEEARVDRLFGAHAPPGARLLTYRGLDDIRLSIS